MILTNNSRLAADNRFGMPPRTRLLGDGTEEPAESTQETETNTVTGDGPLAAVETTANLHSGTVTDPGTEATINPETALTGLQTPAGQAAGLSAPQAAAVHQPAEDATTSSETGQVNQIVPAAGGETDGNQTQVEQQPEPATAGLTSEQMTADTLDTTSTGTVFDG